MMRTFWSMSDRGPVIWLGLLLSGCVASGVSERVRAVDGLYRVEIEDEGVLEDPSE